jgi:hypothetical protein
MLVQNLIIDIKEFGGRLRVKMASDENQTHLAAESQNGRWQSQI